MAASVTCQSLTMRAGTRLGGTGFVPSTTMIGGSTLAPGNSIGTLEVIGNVSFQPGSSYAVEADGDGSSDLTLASGTLTPTGGAVAINAGSTHAWAPANHSVRHLLRAGRRERDVCQRQLQCVVPRRDASGPRTTPCCSRCGVTTSTSLSPA